MSQSHLGQSITKFGYVFSVLHNAVSQYVLFREEAVDLGWFPGCCMFSGICCNTWKISLSYEDKESKRHHWVCGLGWALQNKYLPEDQKH